MVGGVGWGSGGNGGEDGGTPDSPRRLEARTDHSPVTDGVDIGVRIACHTVVRRMIGNFRWGEESHLSMAGVVGSTVWAERRRRRKLTRSFDGLNEGAIVPINIGAV